MRRPTAGARIAGAHLRSLLPRLSDYAGISRSWRGDLIAGVTVGIVALPLALGFGVSSGVGAEVGLVTAIVAGFIAAVFGGSHVQVTGPTGAMVVVLAPIVASHGVGAIAALSLLAGLIVLLAGLLRLGRVVSLVPWPVIEGFTLGIAVIIFLQQVPALTTPNPEIHEHHVVLAAIASIVQADPRYLVFSLLMVAIVALCIVVSARIHPLVPGSLIAVVLATAVSLLVGGNLTTIGTLPSSLPAPVFPELDLSVVTSLMPAAFAVAALAAVESLLSARVASGMADTGPVDADRELLGQGLASIGAGFFGGMPATGAIARTAVNVRAGARTRVAAAAHAIVLLVIVLAVSGPVSTIPLAALCGVLMVTAVRMVDRRGMRTIFRSTRGDAAAFVITAVVTVSVDLIVAVVIGVAFAALLALRSVSRSATTNREELPGIAAPGDEHIAVLSVDGPLIFSSADQVLREVSAISGIWVVILRLSRVDLLDATGAHELETLVQRLERRGITVLVKGVREHHHPLLERVGVFAALRDENHLHTELDAAVAHAREHVRRQLAESA